MACAAGQVEQWNGGARGNSKLGWGMPTPHAQQQAPQCGCKALPQRSKCPHQPCGPGGRTCTPMSKRVPTREPSVRQMACAGRICMGGGGDYAETKQTRTATCKQGAAPHQRSQPFELQPRTQPGLHDTQARTLTRRSGQFLRMEKMAPRSSREMYMARGRLRGGGRLVQLSSGQ